MNQQENFLSATSEALKVQNKTSYTALQMTQAALPKGRMTTSVVWYLPSTTHLPISEGWCWQGTQLPKALYQQEFTLKNQSELNELLFHEVVLRLSTL